jgi:hypothetical protein
MAWFTNIVACNAQSKDKGYDRLTDRDEGLPEFTSMTGTLLDRRVYGDLHRASDTSACPDVALRLLA